MTFYKKLSLTILIMFLTRDDIGVANIQSVPHCRKGLCCYKNKQCASLCALMLCA